MGALEIRSLWLRLRLCCNYLYTGCLFYIHFPYIPVFALFIAFFILPHLCCGPLQSVVLLLEVYLSRRSQFLGKRCVVLLQLLLLWLAFNFKFEEAWIWKPIVYEINQVFTNCRFWLEMLWNLTYFLKAQNTAFNQITILALKIVVSCFFPDRIGLVKLTTDRSLILMIKFIFNGYLKVAFSAYWI